MKIVPNTFLTLDVLVRRLLCGNLGFSRTGRQSLQANLHYHPIQKESLQTPGMCLFSVQCSVKMYVVSLAWAYS